MIKRLIVWGARDSLDSIRHVWRSFYETAGKIGIDSLWVADRQGFMPSAGDTVIAADVTAKNLPFVKGVDYVLHNFDGSHPICQQASPANLLRLQVFTFDATGEPWDLFRRFNHEARTLFQPWGTDLLPEEFMEPVYNGADKTAVFVGAVWREMYQGNDLGNEAAIQELEAAVKEYGLSFNKFTQIETWQMVNALRSARLTPAIAGGWQVEHGYIPCRVLKNPSYGCLSFTNIPEAEDLLGVQPEGERIIDLVGNTLRLSEEDYKNMVREQQEWILPYNYRESLLAIDRALEEGR